MKLFCQLNAYINMGLESQKMPFLIICPIIQGEGGLS
jgi:hypothetical protein